MTQPETTPGNQTQEEGTTQSAARRTAHKITWRRPTVIVLSIVAAAVAIGGGYIGYLYASTPLSIRQPLFEHYHFRMSLEVSGQEANFSEAKYQEGYSKDNCNAALTQHPIHFHDKKNHFVHIHWEGMTGGQVLKYYGWNLIGGTKDALGFRFDDLPKLQKVPVHGNVLPAIPDGANYFIYTGNAENYNQRKFEEFIGQDLEKFFGKESNSPAHKLNQQKRSGLTDKLFPKAHAHGTLEEHAAEEATGGPTIEELTQLNNLIGDVVIFVQKTPPSASEIQDRFDKLEPLGTSTCGG